MKKARTHQGYLQVSERVRDALMKRVQRGSRKSHLIKKKNKKCFKDKMEVI